jgi:general secretion pathway protein E
LTVLPAGSASRLSLSDEPEGDAAVRAGLGALLVERGVLDPPGLDRARQVAAGGRPLEEVLIQLGLAGERSIAEAFATLLGGRLVPPEDYPGSLPTDRLNPRFLHRAAVVPLVVEADRAVLAMARPLDRFARRAVALALRRRIEVRVAVPVELEAALERLCSPDGTTTAGPTAGEGSAEDPLAAAASVTDETERLKDLAAEAPVIRLVNQLIDQAVEARASDVHLEPADSGLSVRLRVDGLLVPAEPPPARLAAAVISRLKIMAKLDIAERRLPQDGRMRVTVRGQTIDFRISVIPALTGESVVLRILDRGGIRLDFAELGLASDLQNALRAALERTTGILLVTGPTGSGKTTTLYTALGHIDHATRKVITLEDPVEYRLPGIVQMQVKPQIELDFARLLRAILRHDPDVIMVGEIRDLETAQVSIQAALTGHVVLSTLHTNGALATLDRLRDMGIEDYLLAATLNGVMAQRLVRRLCPACRVPAAPETRTAGPEEHRPAGCPKCRGTGYRGRMMIGEWLPMDEAMRTLVIERAGPEALRRAALARGFRTMEDDGRRKVEAGLTTPEEVARSIRDA